ncbi:hypothetical protein DY000_02059691 [Brassica cretica]|uniref:Uncharacterized protein n=1 Tax=Brassica cretica TaxID=69181 RepID=A0ABQ7B1K6_BRACR|nr:hypothetical protein DY000_02059691 [Brassica cretica]
MEGSQPVDLTQHPSRIVPTLLKHCFNSELRLQVIALQARNAESNPKRFAAVIMRIREPNTDGKMILAL